MYTSAAFDSLTRDISIRYMDNLIRRNPLLIEAAISLHRSHQIPPNTYLLDLDAHQKNARAITREAERYGVSNYFMSKQIGRNPIVCRAVINEGIKGVVAVESQEARSLHRYGVKIGHVGHLVQIPLCDTEYVMSMEPEVWTVYNYENAVTVSKIAEKKRRVQNLLVQPVAKDDLMFATMTGGIEEEKFVEEVKKIAQLTSVKVVGTTSFPCLMYDLGQHKVRPISNFYTAVRAAGRLQSELGLEVKQINVPGHSEAATMEIIAKNGGTHGEPGSGVSGGLPWQVFEDQPEIPAFVYVTEVSHSLGNRLFVHGGGMNFPGGGYGVFPDGSLWVSGTDIAMDTLVGSSRGTAKRVKAKFPGSDPFNYNLTLFPDSEQSFIVGDTVVYGFSLPQIFTTRAWHAVVAGVQQNNPRLLGIFDQGNNLVDSHGHLLGEEKVKEILRGL